MFLPGSSPLKFTSLSAIRGKTIARMSAMTPNTTPPAAKPPIQLSGSDYDVIADLALSIERHSPELSKLLLDEIDRADIHDDGALPADVVALGSEVEFLDVECRCEGRGQAEVGPGALDEVEGAVGVPGDGLGQQLLDSSKEGREPRDVTGRERRCAVDGVDQQQGIVVDQIFLICPIQYCFGLGGRGN